MADPTDDLLTVAEVAAILKLNQQAVRWSSGLRARLRSGAHRKTTEVCTVSVLSPRTHLVSVDISRGRMNYAARTAVVHAGRTGFALRGIRAITRGRYLVTIVEGRTRR